MRALIVCTLLLLWVAPALAEQKSGPDGFGPIKFGMTKDEAWEAIGGQGAWNEEGDFLGYTIAPSKPRFGIKEFKVSQQFKSGRAWQAKVNAILEVTHLYECMFTAIESTAYVSNLYNTVPVVIAHTEHDVTWSTLALYQFHFADGSSMQTEVVIREYGISAEVAKTLHIEREEPTCSVTYYYTAPPDMFGDSSLSSLPF